MSKPKILRSILKVDQPNLSDDIDTLIALNKLKNQQKHVVVSQNMLKENITN